MGKGATDIFDSRRFTVSFSVSHHKNKEMLLYVHVAYNHFEEEMIKTKLKWLK